MSNPMQSKPAYCIFLVPAQEEPRSQGPKRAFEKKKCRQRLARPPFCGVFKMSRYGSGFGGPVHASSLDAALPHSPDALVPVKLAGHW